MFNPGDFVRFKSYSIGGIVVPQSKAFMVVYFDSHEGCYVLKNQFKETRKAVADLLVAY
jgi:hypothetical protein